MPSEGGWVLGAIVSILTAIYLTRSYLKYRIQPEQWLAAFIWARALFFICVTLALPVYLWTKSVVLSGIFLTVFWIFAFISFMMMPSFTCHFWKPELKKIYQVVVAGLGIVAIILLLRDFQPIIWNPVAKMVFQVMPYNVGKWMYPVGKLLVMIPAGTLFLAEGLATSGRARLRAIFWALGFYWVATTIFIPGFVIGPFAPNFVGPYCVVAEIFFGLGTFFRPKR